MDSAARAGLEAEPEPLLAAHPAAVAVATAAMAASAPAMRRVVPYMVPRAHPRNSAAVAASGNGGPGAAGGGLVQLTIGGRLILNGAISASGLNATNSRAGGGSGGGIWFSCNSFEGSGSISANGGVGEPIHGGGGGGGRLFLL